MKEDKTLDWMHEPLVVVPSLMPSLSSQKEREEKGEGPVSIASAQQTDTLLMLPSECRAYMANVHNEGNT